MFKFIKKFIIRDQSSNTFQYKEFLKNKKCRFNQNLYNRLFFQYKCDKLSPFGTSVEFPVSWINNKTVQKFNESKYLRYMRFNLGAINKGFDIFDILNITMIGIDGTQYETIMLHNWLYSDERFVRLFSYILACEFGQFFLIKCHNSEEMIILFSQLFTFMFAKIAMSFGTHTFIELMSATLDPVINEHTLFNHVNYITDSHVFKNTLLDRQTEMYIQHQNRVAYNNHLIRELYSLANIDLKVEQYCCVKIGLLVRNAEKLDRQDSFIYTGFKTIV